MKKIFLSLLFIVSAFVSFGQSGSQALSGVFLRVNDTTTYQAAAATRHSQGYHDIYFNNQATTPHFDIWNGSSYDHVFDFNAGSSSESAVFSLTPNIQTTSFTLSPADTATMIILDNVADLVIDLDDFSAVERGMQFVFYRKLGTDTVYFDSNGETLEFTTLGVTEKSYAYLYYNPDDNEFYLSGASGSGGGASGTVTSVDVAVGTAGTDIASSGGPIMSSGTITIDIPTASASNRGALSSTDWSTFNNKVSTTRTISTTSPLTGGGDLSANRTFAINDAAADGSTKGAASFTANDFNASSGNISIDYTNGQASGSGTKGFLTGTDWDTFNSKQATGLSWLLASGGTLSGANTLVGTTSNYIKFQYASLGNSAQSVTNGAGIYLQNPTAAALGAQQRSPGVIWEGNVWNTTSSATNVYKWIAEAQGQQGPNPASILSFQVSVNGVAYQERFSVNSSGGVQAVTYTAGQSNSFLCGDANHALDTDNNGVTRVRSTLGTTANQIGIKLVSTSGTATTGTQTNVSIGDAANNVGFAPTSGSGNYVHAAIPYTVNQTGGANGSVVGLDIIPTLTSLGGTHTAVRVQTGNVLFSNGNLTLGTAGNKLSIKEGTNASLGQATLVGGAVTVTNTSITANSKIFLTVETPGGTQGFLSYTKSAATSFTINSTSGTETSTVNWIIIEPAP